MHCPSVIPHLANRVCQFCGLYFAFKKSVLNHRRNIHKKERSAEMTCSRVRPVHIAAYRENEAMCILRDDFGCEDVEWIDVEEIDNIETSEDDQSPALTPIINDYQNHFTSFWPTE